MNSQFKTMQELVEALATQGQADCLLWFEEQGSDSLSYAAFSDMAGRIALGLAAREAGPENGVALFAENRWQTAVLAAGIVLSGAAAVPLDPQLSGDALRHVLADAAPSLVLASEPQEAAIREAVGEPPCEVLYTDTDEGDRSWRQLAQEKGPAPRRAAPGDTVALFYTSGTTGRPKGVPLTHANLVFQQQALINSGVVSPGDRVLLPLPLHHVYPFVVGLFAPLALGLCVIFPRALVGAEVARAVREGRATVTAGAPRLYEALVGGVLGRMDSMGFVAGRAAKGLLAVSRIARRRFGLRLGKILLGSLHRRMGRDLDIMASGGALLEPELAWTMEALGWRVAIGYGLTETSPILCLNPPGDGHFETVGPPLEGVELRIDQAVGSDQSGGRKDGIGEVQARGPGVFAGYRNLPDTTREAFTPDGWFKTGDLGRMQDGRLQLCGRASTLIVTRSGENVQPDAVEQALDKHMLIKESGVLERDGKIAVLIVPDVQAARKESLEPEDAARQAVREVAQSLPSYQRPAHVALTATPIDRTRLGKIRRHKLEEHFDRALEGISEQDMQPMPFHEMAVADRRLLEQDAAAAAWNVLAQRYPKRRLAPDSDLAGDLGVDSLEWLDLSVVLAERTGAELDEELIASIHSVRDLLRAVNQSPVGAGNGSNGRRANPVQDPDGYLDEAEKELLQPSTGWRLRTYKTLHAAAGPLIRALFRLQAHGLEHLERQGPMVLTPNHVSYLDPIVLAAALPFSLLERTHFIGWQGAAFANVALAFISRTAQGIPIDPAKRPGASLALGAGVLARGRNLVWFPEGMRSRTGALAPFQPGLGRILASRGAWVVPVHIQGTFEAMPTGRWWIQPVQTTVTFGEPVSSQELCKGSGEDASCETAADCAMQSLRRRMEEMSK